MRTSGFFSDLPYRNLRPVGQSYRPKSIHDAVGESDPDHRRLVVSYLAGGVAISRVPGRGLDVFDETTSVSLDIVTDGDWVWPLDAAHYCDSYGVLPEPELMRRALDHAGVCPAVDLETTRRIAAEFFDGAGSAR
jgi:hypothetical protein